MTLKRKLYCSNPDCPHERMKKASDWIREKLPNSYTGMRVSDLDFVIWNDTTKNLLLMEVKTKSAPIKPFQREMWKRLHKWISSGSKADGWNYHGFHLLTFEKSGFDDGDVYLDNKKITETQLIKLLSIGGSIGA